MSFADKLFDRFVLPVLRRREVESRLLRAHFKRRYDIEVGLYSYGCFDRWRIPGGTRIGRYCSFAKTCRVIDANHPIDSLSTHPFLYDVRFGIVSRSRVMKTHRIIEDDVWIGHNAIVTPGAVHIGRGAIIGSGAIVTRNVPRYAVVAGVPARILRYRFEEKDREILEESAWWLLDRDGLRRFIRDRVDVDDATGQYVGVGLGSVVRRAARTPHPGVETCRV